MRKGYAAILLVVFPMLSAAQEPLTLEGRHRVDKPQIVSHKPDHVSRIGSRIRVCTYNIENFTDGYGDGRSRTAREADIQARMAAQLLHQIDPDIIVIQEIENDRALSLLNKQFPQPYPMAYITRFTSGTERHKLNIAALSRYPLRGVRELDFGTYSGSGRPPRGVLSFYVDLGDRHHLLIYAVHLKSNWGTRHRNIARRKNALRIVRADADRIMEKHPEYKWEVMIIGDVNVDPESEGFGNDNSLTPLAGWKDLWLGRPLEERITIPTRYGVPQREFPPASFDRVFVSPELLSEPWTAGTPESLKKGVNTEDVNAMPGKDKTQVSDHYPVYVDLWELRSGD